MERAKVSGSLELPPELLEVMEQLQQGTGTTSTSNSSSPTLSRSNSARKSISAGKVNCFSDIQGSADAAQSSMRHS